MDIKTVTIEVDEVLHKQVKMMCVANGDKLKDIHHDILHRGMLEYLEKYKKVTSSSEEV